MQIHAPGQKDCLVFCFLITSIIFNKKHSLQLPIFQDLLDIFHLLYPWKPWMLWFKSYESTTFSDLESRQLWIQNGNLQRPGSLQFNTSAFDWEYMESINRNNDSTIMLILTLKFQILNHCIDFEFWNMPISFR